MKNTVLWALDSKCGFNCKYCYLNFPKEENPINNKEFNDLSEKEELELIPKLKENNVERIFIAGAEPLSNPIKTFKIIKEIKKHDIQVVLCTNAYNLDKYFTKVIECDVDAVSISLDSYDEEYNNKYRQYPNNNGWEKVIKGIKLLDRERKIRNSKVKIGIYTVITKINIKHLIDTYKFISKLGVDYYIFQPIYLNEDSKLYNELSLNSSYALSLEKIIKELFEKKTKTLLPNKKYIELLIKSIKKEKLTIDECFAGDNLFFITPNGNIHPCPSSKCIANQENEIKITDNLKEVLIDKKYRVKCCNNFSEDCVNMWQLMSFDEILG